MLYFLFFALAASISVILTLVTRSYAQKKLIVDDPSSEPRRKYHLKSVPLLGGWPIGVSIIITLLSSLLITQLLVDSFLSVRQLIGLCCAILILVIGGTIDDKQNISPFKQLIWPIIACGVLIVFGIGIDFITNPFGGVFELNTYSIKVLTIHDVAYSFTVLSDIFTLVWLMVLMYATKLLDGLDGLASGVGTIAAVVLFVLSLRPDIAQPGTALFAIIIAGAFFGFWIFNKHPASIFLGEGGSLLIGFLLGVLAIISGAKIATAILILALPLLDVVWVILARLLKKKKIFSSDRLHLHFRLVDAGISYPSVVWIFYGLSALFGVAALVSSSKLKFILLIVAVCLSLVLLFIALRKQKNHA